MPQPVRDRQMGEAQLDQQAGVAVPDIMQGDALDFSVFGSPDHLMLKEGLCTWEYAVVLMEPVEALCIGFQLVPEEFRYRYCADAFWRLGGASPRLCLLCADSIAMGILQNLSICFIGKVSSSQFRYQRTPSKGRVSEAAIMHYLRKYFFRLLGQKPELHITQIIQELQEKPDNQWDSLAS